MPITVLDKLHATWPDLELSVCVLDRQNSKTIADRKMDIKLLSSPLLHTLIYNVYEQGHSAEQPSRSEWPKLTEALVKGASIRVLHLESQQDGTSYRGNQVLDGSEPEKLARLDITPEAHLPPLEELTLSYQRYYGGSNYLWDVQHCNILRDSMDWSRLRKLDFGSDNPSAFFSIFTGLMPSLKALRFGAMEGSIEPAKSFIDSLTNVESLDIARAQIGINTLWPAIMRHKDTLEEIILGPTYGSYYDPRPIELSRLKTITKDFSSLKRIGLDVPCKANVGRPCLDELMMIDY